MKIEYKSVIHRHSYTAGVKPSPVELVPGELALNIADSKLYTLGATGSVIDLTSVASRFNFNGLVDGYVLVFDSASGRFLANQALDGGTF